MNKLALYLFVVLYQSIFFQCQNHQFDVEWDQKLINIDKAFQCGIENRYKKGSTARVINGKIATNIRYPWMAEILRLAFYPKQSGQPGFENIQSAVGTGSIISHKAILTAAHNLCNVFNDKLQNTWNKCHEDLPGSPSKSQNQNRLFNQIHYSVGTMNSFNSVTKSKLVKDQLASFKKEINAFIYKYDPDWYSKGTDDLEKKKRKYFTKNGDIGLIIVESKLGLDLKLNRAIPICLPTPKTISENQNHKGELKVTAVGRGKIYSEFKDKKGNKKQSCMTNEGLVKKKAWSTAHIQEIFLQCKHDSNKEDNCLSMEDACIGAGDNTCKGYKHQLLSTNVKVQFFGNPQPPLNRMRISIPPNDECEKLSQKVNKAVDKLEKGKQRIFHKDDGLGPSRILVFDKDGEDTESLEEKYNKWKGQVAPTVPYCYNLKRLAQWGICETLGNVNSYNFGFCSSSCKFKGTAPFQDGNNEIQFLEFKATYHETWDDTNDDWQSKYC